jgi:cytochrome c-type biogenesis protein
MQELLEGFGQGSAAILNTACLLPLYPGLIAFLAGNANNQRSRRATGWLGLIVLLGILTMMVLVALAIHLFNQSFPQVLPVLLPLVYVLVITFGVMMLLDRNPFVRLATVQAPLLSNPYATAYVYGLLFGPMALPCIGPFLTASFALGARDASSLAGSMAYFVGFGFGFGWPLVVLPLIALPVQKRLVTWLAKNHQTLNRVSGILLIAVGVFGILTELMVNWNAGVELPQNLWGVYWVLTAALMITVGWWTYRGAHRL